MLAPLGQVSKRAHLKGEIHRRKGHQLLLTCRFLSSVIFSMRIFLRPTAVTRHHEQSGYCCRPRGLPTKASSANKKRMSLTCSSPDQRLCLLLMVARLLCQGP